MTEIFETINFTMTLLLPSEYRMRIMYESQPALFSYTQNKTNEERWWLWEEHETQKQTKLKSFLQGNEIKGYCFQAGGAGRNRKALEEHI